MNTSLRLILLGKKRDGGASAGSGLPSSPERLASPAVTRQLKPAEPRIKLSLAGAKALYFTTRMLRQAFSLVTLTVPLAYFGFFILGGGWVRPQAVEGTALMAYMRSVVVPVVAVVDSIFTFRWVIQGWNFMFVALGILALIARYLVLLPLARAEEWAKTKSLRARSKHISLGAAFRIPARAAHPVYSLSSRRQSPSPVLRD